MKFFDTSDLKTKEIYLSLTETAQAIPERKWAPVYRFDICLLDDTKIGTCNLKIDNTEVTKYCGNIGYIIDEKYRGHNYSALASRLLLKLAEKHNLKYVSITCEPDNIASNKICRLLGAKLTETVYVPLDHEMYNECKKLNIYKIALI